MRSEAREYGLYFRLKKISCGFKDQASARPSGEKCGLEETFTKYEEEGNA